jgi:hypothetical protein
LPVKRRYNKDFYQAHKEERSAYRNHVKKLGGTNPLLGRITDAPVRKEGITQEQKVAKARASYFSKVRFITNWIHGNSILHDAFHFDECLSVIHAVEEGDKRQYPRHFDETDIALIQNLMRPVRLFRISPGIIIEAAKTVATALAPASGTKLSGNIGSSEALAAWGNYHRRSIGLPLAKWVRRSRSGSGPNNFV